jgi:hypothetical protein
MNELTCYLKPEFIKKKEVSSENDKEQDNGDSKNAVSEPPNKKQKRDKGMNKVSEKFSK